MSFHTPHASGVPMYTGRGPSGGRPSGSPTPTAAEYAAQMVATSLAKLSKEKKTSITLSGKRDEVRSWLFVFEDTLGKVFGYEVIPRLLRPANNNPEC